MGEGLRFLVAAPIAALLTALPACVATGESITDSTETVVEVPVPPRRVVSLAPSLTRQLLELDAGGSLVGMTIFCEVPEGSKVEKVGTVVQPSVEKIAALAPDIVLATKEGNRPAIGQKLRSLGLPLFVFKERSSFDDICAEFELLGRILRRADRAKEMVGLARARVARIEKRVKGREAVSVFLAYGTDPIVGASKGTFGDDMIARARGINISRECASRYPRYGLERLIREDPDVLLVIGMGADGGRQQDRWMKMKGLRAAGTGRIHVIEADPVCSPTPTTYCDGLQSIAEALHPGGNEPHAK